MSVTFTVARKVQDPQFGEVFAHGALAIDCQCVGCSHNGVCTEVGCEDFEVWGFCDHTEAVTEQCPVRQVEVNVANTNARMLLERLGLVADDDLCGAADPAVFLGHVLTMNVGKDDSGVADSVTEAGWAGPGMGPTVVDCGLRPGYWGGQEQRLADLAVFAKEHDCQIGWG